MQGFPDPGDSFLVRTALSGLAKSNCSLDLRLPITVPILSRLLLVVSEIIKDPYDQRLLRAMLSLAFFAFLRVGEFTTRSSRYSSLLLRSDLQFDLATTYSSMSLVFRKYKHSKGGRPVIINIQSQSDLNIAATSCY